MNEPTYSIDEFERESRYIDSQIWDALAIDSGERVLFCGYGDDGAPVKRALDAGAKVTVIEHRDQELRKYAYLDSQTLRGSTSVIPARDGTFDVAIAFHYLHEVDPFFHQQVVGELARVAKRVGIVEPAPPSDPLGKRIALLYSQAKRSLGQFEYYQPLDYWKKLVQAVKADINQSVFAFAKVPPRHYLQDTIKLLLDTIEAEEAPRAYMDELRAIARRSDVQLLPPARYVLVGAAAGALPKARFTQRQDPALGPAQLAAQIAAARSTEKPPTEYVAPETPAEVPTGAIPPQPSTPAVPAAAVQPPAAPPPVAAQPPAPPPVPTPSPFVPYGVPQSETPFGAPPPANPFGAGPAPFGTPPPPSPFGASGSPWGPAEQAPEMPPPFGTPFSIPPAQLEEETGTPFGLPPMPGQPPSAAGWKWEPPEGEDA
ncbi:MAG: methyltransferase domain-containing protein [Candidatus Eremiobacteraeota bacterium]|nr:methyltransferase domain-containing protein [Candidatus Eremiobacteraeota bacterium]